MLKGLFGARRSAGGAASDTTVRVLEATTPPMRTEGGGALVIRDCLAGFSDEAADPFLLLHEFGPMEVTRETAPRLGMHPHRGFNEVPYCKQGALAMADHWGHVAHLEAGGLQWGKVGSGIEHGSADGAEFEGTLHGFQLWVNLPAASKMDPPAFQDVSRAAMPELEPAPGVRVKVLVGALGGARSPVHTDVRVQYLDVELQPGATYAHTYDEPAMSARFALCYDGAGMVDTEPAAPLSDGKCVRLSAGGAPAECLRLVASERFPLRLLLLAGEPIGEPIVRYGPFVMSTQQEIAAAFAAYQQGQLCLPTPEYRKL